MKNSSQDRMAYAQHRALLAEWLRRQTLRTEVLGSNPEGRRIRSRPLLGSFGKLELWAASLACQGSINGRNSQ